MHAREPLRPICASGILSVLLLAFPTALHAADPTGWKDTAEFSFVATAGNSEANTVGFKNTLSRAWDDSSVTFKAGGVRVQTTRRAPFAVGGFGSFAVTPNESTETTAESYYLNGRYDRKISERFFWYAGAGWDRNRFAGIDSRYSVAGGVGNTWYDTDDLKFKTDYAVTYTDQQNVVEVAGTNNSWVGARFSWDYLNKLGANTTYTNALTLDANLQETSDWRADMTNAVSVSMSEHLALKVSLQWLYDHDPALESIPLFDLPPGDPAAVQLGTVAVPLDELDTIFTASLVVNY